MIDRNIFSSRLKQLRTAKGFSVTGVARSLGLKHQSVFTWENMKTVPSADKLVELALLLETSLDYLVGRTDNPDSHKS
jgi:transcriptional regulator with XRE-family HTH domain